MARRVDLSLSEKIKPASELELPGVSQTSMDSMSCLSKKGRILLEVTRARATVAENEREAKKM